MARTTSYGMGQYRYNSQYNYLINYPINNDSFSYYKTNYQDVCIKLPMVTSGTNSVPLVQYGRTFYVRLTVPQNSEYVTTLNLKLCPAIDNNVSTQSIDASRFQHIKRLIIPPTPEDDNDSSPVILFSIPGSDKIVNPKLWEKVNVHLWDERHDYTKNNGENPSTYKANEVYLIKNGNSEEYRYCIENSSSFPNFMQNQNSSLMDDKRAIHILPNTWEIRDTEKSTVTFDFVFSPKYNLTEGYAYLLLETDRSDSYHQDIQYVEDKITYHGTRIDKDDIKIELYSVSNLLERGSNGQSQIQSGTTSLTHIGVWGHPEQLLAINGEEIRIGQSGFYELNDFNINQLGVVVYDKNKDRFTIDYEYKIIT